MLLILLTLLDLHTLFVLLFWEYLSPLYVFAGSSFILLKGGLFYAIGRDWFSLLDVIIGVLMLLLLLGPLPAFIAWPIGIFLLYKIILGFMSL